MPSRPVHPDNSHIPFFVTPGCPVATVILRAEEIRKTQHTAALTLLAELKIHGAQEYVTAGRNVIGFTFDPAHEPSPADWIKESFSQASNASGSYFRPRRTTKLGKAMYKRIAELPTSWDQWLFSAALSEALGDMELNEVNSRGYTCTVYGRCDNVLWLMVPAGRAAEVAKIPGLRELKLSEYHKILEDFDDKQQAEKETKG